MRGSQGSSRESDFHTCQNHQSDCFGISDSSCSAEKGLHSTMPIHIPDMFSASHSCMLGVRELCKTPNLSLYPRSYLSFSLFITTISIVSILCPDINNSARAENAPSVIHIGALVSYDTIIGNTAIKAIKMALDDINKDKNVLNTSQLVLHLLDTNCTAFTGVAAGNFLYVFCIRIVFFFLVS
jgi:hypothetical protein